MEQSIESLRASIEAQTLSRGAQPADPAARDALRQNELQPVVDPNATLHDGTPLASAARARAAELAQGATATTTAPTSAGLVTSPDALPGIDMGFQRQPVNSIQVLLGNDSPLLSIFAPAPWMPNGRGFVTVGSKNLDGSEFSWFKATDPLLRNGIDRAKLPSGFFGGPDRPTHVVLRLKKVILVWNFEMSAETMFVYMVNLSDTAQPPHRWFAVSELPASFTKRILDELTEYAQLVAQVYRNQ